MEIYFVRHGQTSGNAARRHQAENSPLTPLGEQQVSEVAKKVRDINPTHLVSSPLLRAVETAKLIGLECDLIPSIDHSLKELRRPDYLYGNSQFTLQSFSLYIRWFLYDTVEVEKYGESYASLRERIQTAQKNLACFPEDARVVVVSHGVFINFFLMHMCNPGRMTLPGAVKTFFRILRTPNTAMIPVFHDRDRKETCSWFLQ